MNALKGKRHLAIFYLIAFVISLNSFAGAQELSADSIYPQYKLSFSERIRVETWDNTSNLRASSGGGNSYFRYYTGIMGQWYPRDFLEIAVKMANESRSYIIPENRPFDRDEIFFDQLYLRWNGDVLGPSSFMAGRQNISLGEGFVINEGGPLDGSRSVYFNAVRSDLEIIPKKILTLIYTVQPQTDNILPVINNKDKILIERQEKAAIVYFTGDFSALNLQAYYVRKDTDSSDLTTYDSRVNCLGARFQSPVAYKVAVTVEGAYEMGSVGESDISAYGGYSYLNWKPGWPRRYPLELTAGVIYLSGDDPATSDYEAWDPLYGRWPKWSNSYIYTLTKEYGTGYWSNLSSVYGKIQANMSKSWKLSLDYHHLEAPERPAVQSAFPGGDGRVRGSLRIIRATYQMNKTITGYVLWENFNPGSYYFSLANSADWVRIEMMISF